MATVVMAGGFKIFIDPSAALAPVRFGLPPHDLELKALRDSIKRIDFELSDTDVVIVTHYHYDHHDPGFKIPIERYASKLVLVKDPARNINISQKIRASKFLRRLRDVGARIHVVDEQSIELGGLRITFSKPIPHGNTTRLGYVLAVRIEEKGDVVSYSSDVEGPLDGYPVDFMCGSGIAIVDGPPTYLVGGAYDRSDIERAKNYLARLAGCVNKLVVDHHLIRDLGYANFFREIYELSGRSPITAAELAGLTPNLLEARRRELYGVREEE